MWLKHLLITYRDGGILYLVLHCYGGICIVYFIVMVLLLYTSLLWRYCYCILHCYGGIVIVYFIVKMMIRFCIYTAFGLEKDLFLETLWMRWETLCFIHTENSFPNLVKSIGRVLLWSEFGFIWQDWTRISSCSCDICAPPFKNGCLYD